MKLSAVWLLPIALLGAGGAAYFLYPGTTDEAAPRPGETTLEGKVVSSYVGTALETEGTGAVKQITGLRGIWAPHLDGHELKFAGETEAQRSVWDELNQGGGTLYLVTGTLDVENDVLWVRHITRLEGE